MGLNDYLLLAVISLAAITDLTAGKIYNKLTYPAILVGFLLPAVGGEVGFFDALAGFLIGFVPLFVVHQMGGIGGGDVKLLGALGALGGYPFILHIMFYSFLIGGLVSISIIIWEGRLSETLRRMGKNLYFLFIPGTKPMVSNAGYKIPFGFAISLGTLWAVSLKIFNIVLI